MSAEGRMSAAFGCATTRIARRLRHEAGFTLIEVLLTCVMLGIISAPISAILSQGAVIAKMARERTGADQLAQTQIESLRSIPYTQVGIVNGNPAGSLAASTSTALPSGEAVTVAWQVTWVNDKVPENPYQSNADYKKVVLTITRNSDTSMLTQKTTFVAAASAPPSAGTTWVQIKRTVQDARDPVADRRRERQSHRRRSNSLNRNDITDASGAVLFPALDPATNGLGTPLYTLVTTYSGYSVFPDDISPGAASSVASTPGLSSISTIKMYKGDLADGERPELCRGCVDDRRDRLARLFALRRADTEHPERAELGHLHDLPIRERQDRAAAAERRRHDAGLRQLLRHGVVDHRQLLERRRGRWPFRPTIRRR